MNLKVLIVDYEPPETYGHWVRRELENILPFYTYVAIVDRDIKFNPDELERLPGKHPNAEIIGVQVISSNRPFRMWESVTFRVRLKKRLRGACIIYSTEFLRSVGGYPDVRTSDTWLELRATQIISDPMRVIHQQNFNLKHSVRRQWEDGKGRADLHYPLWKTVLHAVFRVRPFVLVSFLWSEIRWLVKRISEIIGVESWNHYEN